MRNPDAGSPQILTGHGTAGRGPSRANDDGEGRTEQRSGRSIPAIPKSSGLLRGTAARTNYFEAMVESAGDAATHANDVATRSSGYPASGPGHVTHTNTAWEKIRLKAERQAKRLARKTAAAGKASARTSATDRGAKTQTSAQRTDNNANTSVATANTAPTSTRALSAKPHVQTHTTDHGRKPVDHVGSSGRSGSTANVDIYADDYWLKASGSGIHTASSEILERPKHNTSHPGTPGAGTFRVSILYEC